MGRTKEYLHFLSAAVTKPFRMGAIAPSSKQLAEMTLLKLRPSDRIIEIGPGTGAITRILRQRLLDPKSYLGVDINREFVESLRREFPELFFVQDSAENMEEHFSSHFGSQVTADYVVCSLPWNIWPADHQSKLLKSIIHPLREGGHFATYAYWPLLYTPAGFRFRRALERTFRQIEMTRIVWGNLPPAMVYLCLK